MPLFSERYGHKKPRNAFQIDGIDTPLQNRIWNTFELGYWDELKFNEKQALLTNIWLNHFKMRYDDIQLILNSPGLMTSLLGESFLKLNWVFKYDFIEFIIKYGPSNNKTTFIHTLNRVLEEEMSGYRIVGNKIAPITDKTEIEEIERAQTIENELIRLHLQRALELLSDKPKPDERNSIKESISAVEALCKVIAQTPKASLGCALKEIEKQGKITFHPDIKTAFEKLYSWTSDADGIRHAMMDLPTVSQEDAKFMLITCSAFINYIQEKTRKSR